VTDPENAPREMHEGETLRLSDYADERGWVQNHDFLRCTIQGPALVVFGGTIVHSNQIDGFPDECFYDAGENREWYPGAFFVTNAGLSRAPF
jgi:hypothetical protein